MQITEIINSIPEFMWNNIFLVISTLGCGLIVAFFTSTFLKKKEERTRICISREVQCFESLWRPGERIFFQ